MILSGMYLIFECLIIELSQILRQFKEKVHARMSVR